MSIEEVDEPLPILVIAPAIIVTLSREPAAVPHSPVIMNLLPTVKPEYPFQKAKDATYAPPSTCNIGGIIKVLATKPSIASVQAYRTLPPVHEASIAIDVYKRAMEAPITITQHELLSLSPEVRGQLREVTTTRWMFTMTVPPTQVSLQVAVSNDDEAYDIMPVIRLVFA